MAHHRLTGVAISRLEARLSGRDLNVLRWVSDLRWVTGSQLTRLCFTGDSDLESQARTARRALLRLVRLDVLRRLPRAIGGVRAGSAGFVYCLGPAGQALAMKRGWQSERRWRRSPVPGTLFLAHALRVAELHTLLVSADRSRRLELLELAAEPVCHRSYTRPSGQPATLKPDSYVRLGIGEYEDSYFIEVDLASEGSRAIDRQLREYVAYFDSGCEQDQRGVFPLTLWTTPDAARAEVIEDCIDRLRPGARELFAVCEFKDAVDAVAAASDPEARDRLVPASTIEVMRKEEL